MSRFIIIACINEKGALGKNNKLLYHINNDLVNFARATKYNGVVIMGRKTFESLPNNEPLKNRVNIIITSKEDYSIDGKCENTHIVHSISSALELCNAFYSDKELFVIGGESIYRQFMESGLVNELRLTVVNDDSDGDAYFPNFNEEDWYLYYESMPQVSKQNGTNYTFYYKILKKSNG